MQFTLPDWEAPPNMEGAKKKGAPHASAKNSLNLSHFPNARPDKTHYKLYGTTTNTEQEQLAKEGKSFLCKQSGHLPRDCTKEKTSSNTMQVRDKSRYEIKYARLVVGGEKTSSLQVAKLLTDKRMD